MKRIKSRPTARLLNKSLRAEQHSLVAQVANTSNNRYIASSRTVIPATRKHGAVEVKHVNESDVGGQSNMKLRPLRLSEAMLYGKPVRQGQVSYETRRAGAMTGGGKSASGNKPVSAPDIKQGGSYADKDKVPGAFSGKAESAKSEGWKKKTDRSGVVHSMKGDGGKNGISSFRQADATSKGKLRKLGAKIAKSIKQQS